MLRRIPAVLLSLMLVFSLLSFLPEFSVSAAETTEPVVTNSDSAYFDRVSVLPMNVKAPDFYQQVTNIAGMYIFTMPDGTIYKRIYGKLNGIYGWYVPEGSNNIVPFNAQPIDIQEDVALYNEALSAVEEVTQPSSYVGILPPEHGTYGVKNILGLSISTLMFVSFAAVLALCLAIIIAKSVQPKKKTPPVPAASASAASSAAPSPAPASGSAQSVSKPPAVAGPPSPAPALPAHQKSKK